MTYEKVVEILKAVFKEPRLKTRDVAEFAKTSLHRVHNILHKKKILKTLSVRRLIILLTGRALSTVFVSFQTQFN